MDRSAILHFVKGGEEAIEFLLRNEPHAKAPQAVLILLDMKLANDEAFKMLAMAKNDLSLARIPVIVVRIGSRC